MTIKKIYSGIVVGMPGLKTIKVETIITQVHPLYQKIMRKKRRFLVQCETTVAIGDEVKFTETPPISRHKHFKIVEKTVADK
jgi:small subunit ribosomal protein S17